jgi:hypothetical protein
LLLPQDECHGDFSPIIRVVPVGSTPVLETKRRTGLGPSDAFRATDQPNSS